jgi:hypothetical protein
MEQIHAGLLIPGRGEPVRDATVLIDDGRISYAGPAAGAPAAPGAVTRTASKAVSESWRAPPTPSGTPARNGYYPARAVVLTKREVMRLTSSLAETLR